MVDRSRQLSWLLGVVVGLLLVVGIYLLAVGLTT
jgi:hypothetical protein